MLMVKAIEHWLTTNYSTYSQTVRALRVKELDLNASTVVGYNKPYGDPASYI